MPENRTTHEMILFLRTVKLFDGCEEATFVNLAHSTRLRVVPKGSVVFFQADPADTFYIVISGSIAIMLTSPDGRELVINEVRQGDYFGELALLTDRTRSTSAIAREKSELLVIPAPSFWELLDNHPRITRALLESTARRLSDSTDRESALAFLDAAGRIVRNLLHLDQENSDKGYMTLSQEELAQRNGLSRQTVAKILGRWRRAGWLLTGRGRIMLLNRNALKKVAEQSNV